MGRRFAVVGLCCSISFALWESAAALQQRGGRARKKETKGKKHDLESYGQLKRLKGTENFYEFSYRKRDERGKLKRAKAFVKVPEDLKLFRDVRIRVEQLAEGETAAVFGKPASYDVGSKGGTVGGKDYQIQNSQVVLSGGSTAFQIKMNHKSRRLRGLQWCEGKIAKSSGGLVLDYGGAEYRVTLAKRAPVLKRVESDRKWFKKTLLVRILGTKTEERPETKKSKIDEAFVAKQIVMIDKSSVASAYPLIWGE